MPGSFPEQGSRLAQQHLFSVLTASLARQAAVAGVGKGPMNGRCCFTKLLPLSGKLPGLQCLLPHTCCFAMMVMTAGTGKGSISGRHYQARQFPFTDKPPGLAAPLSLCSLTHMLGRWLWAQGRARGVASAARPGSFPARGNCLAQQHLPPHSSFAWKISAGAPLKDWCLRQPPSLLVRMHWP